MNKNVKSLLRKKVLEIHNIEKIILRTVLLHEEFGKTNSTDVLEIGEALMKLNTDDIIPAGFWIWDIVNNKEFYSPNFRHVLEFKDETDFPNEVDSWQKQINSLDLEIALENATKTIETKGIHPYFQKVTYNTKTNKKIQVLCSGQLIVIDNECRYLIGTHKVVTNDKEETNI